MVARTAQLHQERLEHRGPISLSEAAERLENMLVDLHKDNERQGEQLGVIGGHTEVVKNHTGRLVRIGILIAVILLFIACAVAHMAGWWP